MGKKISFHFLNWHYEDVPLNQNTATWLGLSINFMGGFSKQGNTLKSHHGHFWYKATIISGHQDTSPTHRRRWASVHISGAPIPQRKVRRSGRSQGYSSTIQRTSRRWRLSSCPVAEQWHIFLQHIYKEGNLEFFSSNWRISNEGIGITMDAKVRQIQIRVWDNLTIRQGDY